MNHFWRSIFGYFTFPGFYAWLARQLPQDGRVVEVGVFTGQSAAFLGVELQNLGSNAKIDLVDLFDSHSVEKVRATLSPIAAQLGAFHKGLSWEAAKKYADASLDAVFIDASHTYEDFKRDLDAWLPKVKRDGIIAGHDFTPEFPGVIQAVLETFSSWTIWRGIRDGGDPSMRGKFWPVWCVRVGQEGSQEHVPEPAWDVVFYGKAKIDDVVAATRLHGKRVTVVQDDQPIRCSTLVYAGAPSKLTTIEHDRLVLFADTVSSEYDVFKGHEKFVDLVMAYPQQAQDFESMGFRRWRSQTVAQNVDTWLHLLCDNREVA